jgi:hypothetical protein
MPPKRYRVGNIQYTYGVNGLYFADSIQDNGKIRFDSSLKCFIILKWMFKNGI